MPISVVSLEHVNVRVLPALEQDAKLFYGSVLGLAEIPKPKELLGNGGAWFQLGQVQLHLSRDGNAANTGSKRHICIHVADLKEAQQHLESVGVEIIPDDQPVAGSPRFYVRDPGGNLLEIAEQRD